MHLFSLNPHVEALLLMGWNSDVEPQQGVILAFGFSHHWIKSCLGQVKYICLSVGPLEDFRERSVLNMHQLQRLGAIWTLGDIVFLLNECFG